MNLLFVYYFGVICFLTDDTVFSSKSVTVPDPSARFATPTSVLRRRTPPASTDECRIPVLLAGCRADLFDRHRHMEYRPPPASAQHLTSAGAQSASLLPTFAPPAAQSAAPTAPGSRLTASTVSMLRRGRPPLRNLHIDSDTSLALASSSTSKTSPRNGSNGQISFYLLDEIFIVRSNFIFHLYLFNFSSLHLKIAFTF